jgi:hypothetical protein
MSARTWRNGWSTLVVEHDQDGKVRIRVDDKTKPGFGVMVDRATADEIVEFITEGS